MYIRQMEFFRNAAELDAYPHLPFAQPGDFRLVDVNKDGAITAEDKINGGSPQPKYLFWVEWNDKLEEI